MKASEIMTKRVISIAPRASIAQAIRTMLKNRISGLPVVNRNGKLVGIISEGDLLHRQEIGTEIKRNAWLDAMFGPEQSANDYVRAHGITVGEVMTRMPVITVSEDTSLDQVVHLIERHRIKRLPVLGNGKIVGIISRANLMQALASLHRAEPKSSRYDQAIRRRIVAAIGKQSWSYGADLFVLVRNGVVDLCGTLADPSQRAALIALAAEREGVKQVHDHLRLPDDGVAVT
jgi:CBS domain-containing protein